MIKLILTTGLLFSLFFATAERASSRLLRWLMGLVVAFGIYLVWFPDHSMTISRWVGVGRGADLITYCWIVVSILLILILYLRINRLTGVVTDLTRHIAISEARDARRRGSR